MVTVKQPKSIYDRVSITHISHQHNTRLSHRGGYTLPKPRTKALTRSFLYRCTKAYNTLPSNLITTNCAVFKIRIRDWAMSQSKSSPLSLWWWQAKLHLITYCTECFIWSCRSYYFTLLLPFSYLYDWLICCIYFWIMIIWILCSIQLFELFIPLLILWAPLLFTYNIELCYFVLLLSDLWPLPLILISYLPYYL